MTTPQPDSVRLIPLPEIDPQALPRDRLTLDDRPLGELIDSIAVDGLRMPVEVWELSEARDTGSGTPHRYGLISGFRRLAAYQRLWRDGQDGRFAAIPAFLRQPRSVGQAMAQMIGENEIRVQISPWERARILSQAVDEGIFDTVDAAVAGLYPLADRHKRGRLRLMVPVVEALEGLLATPEQLSQNRMLTLAAGFAAGYGEVIETALEESSAATLEAQWRVLRGVLAELGAEPDPGPTRPGYPRRVVRPRKGLTIRRELTRDGWCLHFTGREAKGGLMDDILDEVERQFGVE
ncbi:MAG TPA: ParB/RepB/Spo0J family partition protein [Thermohalobaculum sp.]|nr:ParB/RepB/Spo0J family partition protein [Thermohalobaculum sp.]